MKPVLVFVLMLAGCGGGEFVLPAPPPEPPPMPECFASGICTVEIHPETNAPLITCPQPRPCKLEAGKIPLPSPNPIQWGSVTITKEQRDAEWHRINACVQQNVKQAAGYMIERCRYDQGEYIYWVSRGMCCSAYHQPWGRTNGHRRPSRRPCEHAGGPESTKALPGF